MFTLRPDQQQVKAGIYAAWGAGQRNTLAVMPTGAGKTVTFSDILHEYPGFSCACAHRQELVGQISLALARQEVRHSIVAPDNVVRNIVRIHHEEVGRSFYEANARCHVAGVDTLIRLPPSSPWLPQVGLWVMDEAHHVLRENKWGRAVAMFPNARGLGVTATPLRADGKGLGLHADGLFESMVQGPTMRELIRMGHLTDYRCYAPPSDLDLSDVPTSAGGDFSPEPLRKAVHRSHIVGDVVSTYLRLARGKLGVTFAVDIEHATEIAQAYRDAGVPAEVVSSRTPDHLRAAILRRFRNREILQLVNVDLFGEGFDLPAIEVVSMARPTQSYGLYVQQFGRALRLMAGKLWAIIIDHVGNIKRHGLPDARRVWSLERRDRRGSGTDDVMPVRTCGNCGASYEAFRTGCPYCRKKPEPAGRGRPEEVDGDLQELTPEVLARMRGEAESVFYAPRIPNGMPQIGVRRFINAHEDRQQAVLSLREAIMLYGGARHADGDTDAEMQRRFFHTFGVDVLSAQALQRAEAADLEARVRARLQ